jgi:hypothetical protein
MSQQTQIPEAVSDKLLERIRSMIQLAEDPRTPPHEADNARQMADALMFKYAVDQAKLDSTKPEAERMKPIRVKMDLVPADNPLRVPFSRLAHIVALHCRCKCIYLTGWGNSMERVEVFGFEPDVRYFELLFTTLFLHMNGVFFPRPDAGLSKSENIITLRGFGMNWLDMARVYGWSKLPYKTDGKEMWRHQLTREEKTNFQLGGEFKKAYHQACKELGIEPKVISSAQSRKVQGDNYKLNAADGYVDQIHYRLRASEKDRQPGAALVLKSRMDEIENMFNEAYPETHKTKGPKTNWDWAAYERGRVHANSADLNASSRMSGSAGRASIDG